MDADRIKWNHRFASEPLFLGVNASPFLQRELETIKHLAPGHRALDIACGEGRNSIFLARNGFRVTGVDISDTGIAKGERLAREQGVKVEFRRTDLDGYYIAEQFDVILNFNFLLRGLIPGEVNALAPGGVLLFDTILESPHLLASHNSDYLLRYGELERTFRAFAGEILFSEEKREDETPTARLMFQKAPVTGLPDS